ncbi:MAG TPA: acyl-CoA dehydrogenase family protein [Candidatus Acidoferrales bacterium]|jgi:alkylation response protein AidB-like acyl-CoA dehydrogenase|nr:acyl-CoA dehydrogenase family protein [Candidatus Acidoferrales bacterium]
MDFSLSDDQRLIRDNVRRFMESEVRGNVRGNDREEKFAGAEIRRLGDLGCCGMLIPEEWGGAGLDSISYVLMLEEVARVDASIAVALSVTNSVVAWPLWRHGTEEQRRKYLPRLARGEMLGAFCLTEPQAGSDAAAIGMRALRAGRSYKLSGTKSWVTNGGESGIYLAFAKTDAAAGGRGVTAFLVEPSFPGFGVARYEDKMGLRSSRSAEIVFSDCEVPEENRLGEEGQGLKIALEALDGGRVGIAAQAVGLAQGALEAATDYARQRRAFGKSIGEFQAIQFMLADMHTEIEAARLLVWEAAWMRDAGAARAGAFASRAKLFAAEMANRVAYRAVQIHGSMGYSRESDVERMYRDARVLSIYEGTSEIQRMIIARDVLAAGHAGGFADAQREIPRPPNRRPARTAAPTAGSE